MMSMVIASQDRETDLPQLSVILAVDGQRERGTRALRSLLEQNIIERMEILLYDVGPPDCPPLPGSDDPRVRLIRQTPHGSLSTVRVHGIRNARSPVVWFMEEHCEMRPGAAEAVLLAHQEPWAGVGCAFVVANPDAGCSDRSFRMSYGSYAWPRRDRGPVPHISGQNSAFKREILLRYNDHLEFLLNTDLVLQFQMKRDGYQLFYEPAAIVAHRSENKFRSFCTGTFYWNWCFAHVRAGVFTWSRTRRAVWIALSPLIPWWRLAKIFVLASRRGVSGFAQFLRDIPFVLGTSYCAAAGQVAGLLNQVDEAERKFSYFEMNEPRLLRTELLL